MSHSAGTIWGKVRDEVMYLDSPSHAHISVCATAPFSVLKANLYLQTFAVNILICLAGC